MRPPARSVVAGVGFRRRASAGAIVALVEEALGRVPGAALARLATVEPLATTAAFREAAAALAVPSAAVTSEALAGADARVPTRSARALAAHGVGSVAEAAALASAGPRACLVLPRIVGPDVTCALAAAEGAP